MFENLTDRLESVFKKLRGHGKLTEENIQEAMGEVRTALLEADVNFGVVKEFVAAVTAKAIGQEVLSSLSPGQQVVKVVHDELVELLGGVLALGCTWRYGAAYALPGGLFGMSWAALLALAVCGILLSVSLIDAETQTIPDRLNLALAVCGAVSVLLSPADWLPHIIGALCVSVPMFLLCLVIDGAFGGGDIKLMAAAGLFLGWQHTLLAMFFGIVFGGMYGIYLLAAKKAGKKDHFAFGPFLCAGIVIAMLFGGPVLEWYCAFL